MGVFDPPKPQAGLVHKRRNTNRAEMLDPEQLKRISQHKDKTLAQDVFAKSRKSMGAEVGDRNRLEAAQSNIMKSIKEKEREALAKKMGLNAEDLDDEEDVDAEVEENDSDG